MNYIAINSDGGALYDFRIVSHLQFFVDGGVSAEDISENNITSFATSNNVVEYVGVVGYVDGAKWIDGQWRGVPTTYWAVYNPTVNDLANSYPVLATSLDGIRSILQPYSTLYEYEGAGKHTGASGADIPAIELTADEVNILLDSTKFSTESAPEGLFVVSDAKFCIHILQYLKLRLLHENGTSVEQAAAVTLLQNVFNALLIRYVLVASTMFSGLTPAGIFTATIKMDTEILFTNYLNKFPR
jgi:hypothetical protein